MSADQVRITCGLGAWHDGHRDRVLAIAVREPDPVRADAKGWRILTGPELRGDLAETERRVGPVVDSTDNQCPNCIGYSRIVGRRSHPHSDGCRIIRPLCKCGWPGPTVAIVDLVPLFERAAASAQGGADGYISVADLYPLAEEFRFWNRPTSEEIKYRKMARLRDAFTVTGYANLYVMCDGQEETPSRRWHLKHGATRILNLFPEESAKELRALPMFSGVGALYKTMVFTPQICHCGRTDLPLIDRYRIPAIVELANSGGIRVLPLEGFASFLQRSGLGPRRKWEAPTAIQLSEATLVANRLKAAMDDPIV